MSDARFDCEEEDEEDEAFGSVVDVLLTMAGSSRGEDADEDATLFVKTLAAHKNTSEQEQQPVTKKGQGTTRSRSSRKTSTQPWNAWIH